VNDSDNTNCRWRYICSVRNLISMIVVLLLSGLAAAQKTVSFFTEAGGVIYANVLGEGPRTVVLSHGGQFNKENWEKQARIWRQDFEY